MTKILIMSPWRSTTPRQLAIHLRAKLLKLERVTGVEKTPDILINWGCSNTHNIAGKLTINSPAYVRQASNKANCLGVLSSNDVPTLEWTGDRSLAVLWAKKGHSVICHSDVHAHSGRGLTRIEPSKHDFIPYSSLFTKYFAKDKELRILCVRNGTGVDTMFLEKKRILPERYAEFGLEGKPDWFIRTHDNGWIFSREAEEITEATEMAKKAIRTIGLTFGAVDILAKKKPTGIGWDCLVGEINTAPGLEGQTLEFFKAGLSRICERKTA